MTPRDLLEQALHVQGDLDALSRDLESSRCPGYVKSRLARDVSESRARIGAVIEACSSEAYVADAVRPAP
jgi:hypothetical protein